MRRLGPIAFILLAALAVAVVGVPTLISAVAPSFIGRVPPFRGQAVSVQVEASFGGLVGGRLDRVRLSGTALKLGGVAFGSLDIALTGVGLDRSFASLAGTADGVTTGAFGATAITLHGVTISGSSAGGISLTGTIDAATVESLVVARFAAAGLAGASARLESGSVTITIRGETVHATLAVVGGAVTLDPGGLASSIVVLEPDGSMPGRVVGLDVAPTGVTVHWRIEPADLGILLGGG